MVYKKSERRLNKPLSDASTYKISDIDKAIKSERRSDELDRLREVHEQKKTWYRVFTICSATMVILLTLAIVGMVK